MRIDVSSLLPADTTLSQGSDKNVTIDNTPDQSTSKQILSDLARKVVLASETGRPSEQKLKLELKGRDVTLRTRDFGSGSHAASSFIKALAVSGYGPHAAGLLEQHIREHGDGKHLNAHDFVQFVSGLQGRDKDLETGDPLKQVHNPETHPQFHLSPHERDIHAPVDNPANVQPEDVTVNSLTTTGSGAPVDSSGRITKDGLAGYIENHRAQFGLRDTDDFSVKKAGEDVRGSSTIGIFIISINGEPALIAKESGTIATISKNSSGYFNYQSKGAGVNQRFWNPQAVEDDLLAKVEASDWAKVGPQKGASGVTVDVAHTEASFRYTPSEKQPFLDQERPGRVEHSVTISRLAPGESFSVALEKATPEEQIGLWQKLGDAVGTLHLRGAKRDDNGELQFEADGSLKTVIHGDLYKSNLAYDKDTDSITFFDLAGVVRSLDEDNPLPFTNTRDLIRMVGQSLSGDDATKDRDAFFTGYVNAFKGATNPEGEAVYTVDTLAELVSAHQQQYPDYAAPVIQRPS